MKYRMTAAVLALAGLFVSLYLWLHKIGVIGTLQCGSGGCEQVQTSQYAALFGVPVAAYGVAGYATLLVVALISVQPRLVERRAPAIALTALAALGFLFTLYLKYVEFFLIRAICRWCVASAVLITAILAVSLLGLRREQPTV